MNDYPQKSSNVKTEQYKDALLTAGDRVLAMATEIGFTLRHNRTMPLQTATLLRTLRERLMSDYKNGKAELACRGLAFLTAEKILKLF